MANTYTYRRWRTTKTSTTTSTSAIMVRMKLEMEDWVSFEMNRSCSRPTTSTWWIRGSTARGSPPPPISVSWKGSTFDPSCEFLVALNFPESEVVSVDAYSLFVFVLGVKGLVRMLWGIWLQVFVPGAVPGR